MSDLRELSRRIGHSLLKLQEALDTIKEYRIKDGLLQRSTCMCPTCTYEYLTVVLDGNWRTVEFVEFRTVCLCDDMLS